MSAPISANHKREAQSVKTPMQQADEILISSESESIELYANRVMGAAIFDLNGLPKEYFTTEENNNMSWVQTIFQALGLRLLLMSSLQLEGFHYAIIHSEGYNAVVVKQTSCYTAFLLKQNEPISFSDAFLNWVQNFEPNSLKNDDRFKSN